MSKAIYDLLNIVDRYVVLTKLVHSKKPVSWDEIVEIQKKVKFILISSDFKSTLQDQILKSKERSYQKLHELFLNSRNTLKNLIKHSEINSSVFFFNPILTFKDKWFKDLIGYNGDVDPSAGHTDPSVEVFFSPTDDLTILLLFS